MVKSACHPVSTEQAPEEIVRLAEERQQARLRQDWATADTVRQKMATLGWLVQDTPEGQKFIRQP
jgi:cysteinyl-tRNA synthetase